MTVKELIELLSTYPEDANCTYDDGLGLTIEYVESENKVDFH